MSATFDTLVIEILQNEKKFIMRKKLIMKMKKFYYYSKIYKTYNLGAFGFYLIFNQYGFSLGICRSFSIYKWHELNVNFYPFIFKHIKY